MKKFTKKWQIILYALSGLGVNMMNLVVTSYLCDALMLEGFTENAANWTYANKTLVVAGVWSVLFFIAKALDGIIDIPFSGIAENLKTKWGKRRPSILFGLILTILSYVLFLNPITWEGESLLNTIYFGVVICAFYAFYTLTMLTYYATFSEVVDNSKDRMLLSNFKSIFDVCYFIFGYALIPALVGGNLNIRLIGYIFLPLSLTMLIPLFMLKEKSTLDKDLDEEQKKYKPLSIIESLKYSIKNKNFVKWMLIYCVFQFGIQMFLTGQNVYCSGVCEFDGGQLAILNALSFAPVPVMLIFYNKITAKKGFKAGFTFALSMFSVGMIILTICNPKIIPDGTIRFVVGAIASLFCSCGIGSFFSVEYIIPSTLAAKEKEEKGISNPGMYFAVQGLVGGVISGLSTGIVWINMKDHGLTFLMGIIVAVCCIITVFTIHTLPKEIDEIGKDIEKKSSLTVEIEKVEK